MVGAILALLAFMLAFTFSMAATRFDSRREAVLDEANAIRTTYLRAQMLPQPEQSAVMRLLRDYVDVRLRATQEGSTAMTIDQAIGQSEDMHRALWGHAVAAAAKSPSDITGLFVQSVNDVMDLHAKRIQVAIRGRVPLIIWIALLALTGVGMAAVGYQVGIVAMKRTPAMYALILGFGGAVYLIADLDRPGEGTLHTNQAAIVNLQRMMQDDAARPTK
jgi:hypothetical protein